MLFTMAHHDLSISERVEKGWMYARTVEELHGVPMSAAREWLQKYRRNVQDTRRKRTGLWDVSSSAQDAALVTEADRIPFLSTRNLKTSTGSSRQKDSIISRLKTAGLREPRAAVKELPIDQHKLYCLAFAESNVDRKWNRGIFSDESTLTTANTATLCSPSGQAAYSHSPVHIVHSNPTRDMDACLFECCVFRGLLLAHIQQPGLHKYYADSGNVCTYCLYLQGSICPKTMLKIKIVYTFEISRPDYDMTWCHITEGQNPQLH